MIIPNSEIEFAPWSLVDDMGRVFFWRGRVLRGIRPSAQAAARSLVDSELFRELRDQQLIARTEVSSFTTEEFPLVLEHERVPYLTLPHEWSFSMLKDAALCVLAINQIARRHGHELKDCHGYNVSFQFGRPVFLDIGSLVPMQADSKGWRAYEDFVRSYLYPLEIWRGGSHYFAQRVLSDVSPIPHASYLLHRHPWIRPMRRWADLIEKAAFTYFKGRLLSSYPPEFTRQHTPTQLAPFVEVALRLKQHGLLPLQTVDLERLQRATAKLDPGRHKTTWGAYHDVHTSGSRLESSPRIERILQLLSEYRAQSVVELAGNQGVVCRLAIERGIVEQAVCTDSDASAIDQLYAATRGGSARLQPAIVDFMTPPATDYAPPRQRLQADSVLALAVVHHLVLKAPFYPVEAVLRAIAAYGRRLAFVEFMPRGLWDGRSAVPLPDWYSLEAFRAAFGRVFHTRLEEQLEDNRVLFVGEVRA